MLLWKLSTYGCKSRACRKHVCMTLMASPPTHKSRHGGGVYPHHRAADKTQVLRTRSRDPWDSTSRKSTWLMRYFAWYCFHNKLTYFVGYIGPQCQSKLLDITIRYSETLQPSSKKYDVEALIINETLSLSKLSKTERNKQVSFLTL